MSTNTNLKNHIILDDLRSNHMDNEQILQWRDNQNKNIFHIIASTNDVKLFNKTVSRIGNEKSLQLLEQANTLGDLPIHIASWANNTNIITAIAEFFTHLDFYDAMHRTPLMIAVKNSLIDTVQLILPYSLHINAQDNKGQTVLHYNGLFGNDAISKILYDAGAEKDIIDQNGKYPINSDNSSDNSSKNNNVSDIIKTTKKKISF